MGTIVYPSLEDAEYAYDKFSDDLKRIWAIVVYKNGWAEIKLREEIKNMKLVK